jgi:hypothetical protein
MARGVSDAKLPDRERESPAPACRRGAPQLGPINRVDGGRNQPYFMYPFLGFGTQSWLVYSCEMSARSERGPAAQVPTDVDSGLGWRLRVSIG